MKIFILPVSGGGFATQLGILYYLLEAKRIIPDIVLGSSGGNVAAYISMLSNWYHKTILKNCHLINFLYLLIHGHHHLFQHGFFFH